MDATRSIQIGIRGHDVWMDPGKTSRELGYRIVTKDEFDDDLGIEGTVALIRDRVGDLPVYVSFDLDALDTTIAPAVSNPEPGEEGLTMKEAIRIIQGMRGLDVIGADVVELMPSVDSPEPDDGAERHPHRLRADLPDRRPLGQRVVGSSTFVPDRLCVSVHLPLPTPARYVRAESLEKSGMGVG